MGKEQSVGGKVLRRLGTRPAIQGPLIAGLADAAWLGLACKQQLASGALTVGHVVC